MEPFLCRFQVGSGKTSLLNSLLGEMQCVNGSILLNGSVAYVPQVCKLIKILSMILFFFFFSTLIKSLLLLHSTARSLGFYLELYVTISYLGRLLIPKG